MDFNTLISIQGFIVAAIFTTAVVLWYRINNENPTLYKCRKAINFILLISFILIIKAFQIIPDPQNIRQLLQHFLTAVISLGFFFEAKKVYKKNLLIRKKELGHLIEPDKKDPIKLELHREVIKPELKRLAGLRKLIIDESNVLEKKKEKLEAWENKLQKLKVGIESEKNNLNNLDKDLNLKEKELKKLDDNLSIRKKKVEIREKTYGQRESKLEGKREEIKEINKKIREEKKDMGKQIKTMKLLEEDVRDQKLDVKRERKKIERLRK